LNRADVRNPARRKLIRFFRKMFSRARLAQKRDPAWGSLGMLDEFHQTREGKKGLEV